MRENFIRINFYPSNFELTDDDAWIAVAEKAKICAEIARETDGGICLDFESYGKPTFKFDPKSGLTFAEAKALARRRGAQFGGAIVEEYPNVVLLALWLNSINFAAGRSETPDAILAGGYYGLLPSFVDGLLDAAAPETKLVDGCENGYYMNGAAEYDRAALDAILATGPGAALVAPENRAKYRSQVQIGFGFYLDMYSNPEGSTYYRGPEPGETRFDRLVANLNAAWNAADEYVWIYGEQKRWRFEDPNATQAEAPSTDSQSWEEAIPGLTDALRELSDPIGALWADRARFESDPDADKQNLIKNGDFSTSNGVGGFENWGTWQDESSKGEFVSLDGAAGAKSVSNGCYIQSFDAKPGDRFFVSAKVKTTSGAFATVVVRWQTNESAWTAENLDVKLAPFADASPDADGWTPIVGRAVVPASAEKLVLLLSSNGAGEKDATAIFDDVKIFRLSSKNVEANADVNEQ